MMTAIETLRREHDAILRMLDATEEAARQLEAGQAVELRVLEGLHEFFRLFADQCHHGKEEDLLFPRLEQKGVPRQGGAIGVMLVEHDQGRAWIRQMIESAAALGQGRPGAGAHWARAARGYISLLRDHIAKENNVLFVMAERLLTPEEQTELAAQFECVETEKMGPGTHERLHGLMEDLQAQIWREKVVKR